MKPGTTTTIGLMFRELSVTNIALKGPAKGITILKGIVEGQEFIIATLSSKHPNQRVNLKFSKDCMFVSFEVVGENEVDVIGYVTGLDATKLMSLKEAMEMSDASDDEEYECSECDGECGGHCNKHEAESDNSKETPSNEDLSRDAVSFDRPEYKHLGKYVRYKDLVVGEGDLPRKGHRVQITYKLTLPTGEVLDSTVPDEATRCPFPSQFRVGIGHICNGVDKAIQTMRIGGVRDIVVAPEMGFGEKGNIVSDIRPGEVFSVEVRDRKSVV